MQFYIYLLDNFYLRQCYTEYDKAKKINLVFRATILKTLGRVGSVFVLFLRIETSIIKTPTKKNLFS